MQVHTPDVCRAPPVVDIKSPGTRDDRIKAMATHNDFSNGLPVDVPAATAWAALEHMEHWLPNLATVRSVEADADAANFSRSSAVSSTNSVVLKTGHRYLVRTSEGPVMHCRIAEVDTGTGLVHIEARLGPLRSCLLCSVEPTGPCACVLRRRQTYPGMIGRLFTLCFGRREGNETTAYLRAWADYARDLADRR